MSAAEVEETQAAPIAVVGYEPDSRLDQLHAAYFRAKEKADAASAELKAITDALKLELTQAAPDGSTRIDLTGRAGPALRMAYSERATFDSKRFKADDPLTYVRYAKFGGSWSLRVAQGGGSDG